MSLGCPFGQLHGGSGISWSERIGTLSPYWLYFLTTAKWKQSFSVPAKLANIYKEAIGGIKVKTGGGSVIGDLNGNRFGAIWKYLDLLGFASEGRSAAVGAIVLQVVQVVNTPPARRQFEMQV